MAITVKDILGLFALVDSNRVYEVLHREANAKGEGWPFWVCNRIDSNGKKQIIAHEDYIRSGKKCIDGSWPPRLIRNKKNQISLNIDIFE